MTDLSTNNLKNTMMYGYYDSYPLHMLGFGVGFLVTILFWGLIVFGLIWLFRHMGGHRGRDYRDHSRAMDILRERYAKGEITKEQFMEMRKEIEKM